MRCAVVVAHPDDELLFVGAMILSRPEDSWHVICLTGDREERAEGFDLSLRRLGTSGEMHDVRDEGLVWSPHDYLYAQGIVRRADLSQYDEIFTHNAKGCYGHPHHVAVSDIVRGFRPDAWVFYTTALTGIGYAWAGESVWTVEAPQRKLEIFREAYGQQLLDSLHHDHTYLMPRLFELEQFTR